MLISFTQKVLKSTYKKYFLVRIGPKKEKNKSGTSHTNMERLKSSTIIYVV